MMNKLDKFPVYVLLLAGYPALALMGHNITENQVYVVIRPFVLSVLFGLIILLISRLLFKNYARAGLFSAFCLLIFFSLGHVLQLLDGRTFLGVNFGRFSVLAAISAVLILAVGVIIFKLKKIPSFLNGYLTLVGVVLLAMPLYQIISYGFQKSAVEQARAQAMPAATSSAPADANLPDIYYIILDSYTRQDALLEHYKFDNQPFIDELKARNFYIAECSRSNYQFTLLSLSSTFNMNYLDQLDSRFKPDDYHADFMEELVDHSQVRADLEAAGYKFIAFQSSYDGTTIEDADELVTYLKNPISQTVFGFLNPFEQMYLNTTAATILFRLPPERFGNLVTKITFANADEAATQLYQLDTLPTIAREPGPKFVFVHMNIPHDPFIFKADGTLQTDPDYYTKMGAEPKILGYINQVEFLNSRLPGIVDQILAVSPEDPIIIIQGDHGMNKAFRSTILNAFYVPDSIRADLYPSITPVNTYRILLNDLLGKDYTLLEDHSYASANESRFNITEDFEYFPACQAPTQ